MAQDKSAEIIKFSGANDAPGDVAPGPQSEEPPVAEAEAPPPSLDETSAGTFLREARARAKHSIEAVSAATKVKAEHLEAIEWMRLDRLPALPYAIGFVKAYARFLALDPEQVAAKFKAEAAAILPAAAPDATMAAPAHDAPSNEGARLGSVFAMLAVALFALWIGYQVIAGGDRQAVRSEEASVAERQPAPRVTTPAPVQPEAGVADGVAVGELIPEIIQPADENVAAEEGAETTSAVDALAAEAAATEEMPAVDAPPQREAAATITEPAQTERQPAAEPTAQPPVQRRDRPLPRRAQPARTPQIIEAELTRSAAPDYPDRCARGARDIESVTILFDVSASGRAVNARVESASNGCFEGEALRTLGRWRFSPRTVDGEAVAEAGKRATLNFRK